MNTNRTDIQSILFTLLGELPRPVLDIIFSEMMEGTEDEVSTQTHTWALQTCKAQRQEGIPVPGVSTDPKAKMAWCAAVESALNVLPDQRTLEVVQPTLAQHFEQIESTTAESLEAARAEVKLNRRQYDRAIEEEERYFAAPDVLPSETLRRQRWPLRLACVGLVALELMGVVSASATFFGVLEYPNLQQVPPNVWMKVFSLGLPAGAAVFIFSYYLGKLIRAYTPGRWFQALAVVGLAVLGLAVFASLGVQRWLGLQDAYSLVGWAQNIGGHSVLVLVLATLALVVLAVETILQNLKTLGTRLMDAQRREADFARRRARCGQSVEELEATIAALAARLEQIRTYPSLFEAGVRYIEERQAEDQRYAEAMVKKACSGWRRTQELSLYDRELLHAEFYRLVEVPRETTNGAARPTMPRLGRGASAPSAVLLVGVMLPALLGSSGCSDTPAVPTTLYVACDSTGLAPEAVCTQEFLKRSFVSWGEASAVLPEARYQVIRSAGSYGTTIPEEALYGLPAGGDLRNRKVGFMREGIETVAGYPLVRDEGTSWVNHSDLLSLLSIISREASNSPASTNALVLASDGWFLSLGFNAEQQVPDAEAVLARLKLDGMAWDFSAFSSVTLCGLHNQGASAAEVAARDALWRALLAAGGSPTPTFSTSCKDVYPPLPAALLVDDSAMGAATGGDSESL
jgi:hypothetical protein